MQNDEHDTQEESIDVNGQTLMMVASDAAMAANAVNNPLQRRKIATDAWERLGDYLKETAGTGWRLRTLADAFAPRPDVCFIAAGILALPSLNVLYGRPGSLKSLLVADLALSVASGTDWLPPAPSEENVYPVPTLKVPVLWVDRDNGELVSDIRFEAIARAKGLEPDTTLLHYVSMPHPPLNASDDGSIDYLIDVALKVEAKLICIDNLSTVNGGVDENSNQMNGVLSNLRRLAEETGSAVLVIHHQRKSTGFTTRAGESLRGHSSIEASLDLALLVERKEHSSDVVVKSTKSRWPDVKPFGAAFKYSWKPRTIELASAQFYGLRVEGKYDKTNRVILEVVEASPDINKSTLIEQVQEELPSDISANFIKKRIETLDETGEVTSRKGAHNATLYS